VPSAAKKNQFMQTGAGINPCFMNGRAWVVELFQILMLESCRSFHTGIKVDFWKF